MSMREQLEAAEQRALEARSRKRDELSKLVGARVRHAYTGARAGTVTRAYLTRNGRQRVTVDWDGGKTATHDRALILELERAR